MSWSGSICAGLLNHVVNLETFDFDRHADIRRVLPVPRPAGMGFLDFPRHGGFFVHLWTFVFAKTGDPKYLDWAGKIIEKFERARSPISGLPSGCPGRRGDRTASAETMRSLSVSLLEASRLLPPGAAQDRYHQAAKGYLDSILPLPPRPDEGRLLVSFPMDVRPEQATGQYSEPFRYEYGGGLTADEALLLSAANRLSGQKRALRLARCLAAYYARHEPPPPMQIVRAHVYASILGLFADLYAITGQAEYLQQAERYARLAIGRLFHRGLLRGATGIDHYEGDMMVGNLVYNLVWLHSLKAQTGLKVEPNYFNR
ncbi:MAG: hypothetical protein ACUVUC_10400 [Thermoguttaceae bacterium]